MEMSVKAKLTDALKTMLSETKDLESWIPETERISSGDYEHWAPKDLIAHSAEWTRRQVQLLRDNGKDTWCGDDESCDVNLVFFERHINTPWKEVVEMLNESIGAIVDEVQRRDEPAFAAANPHDERGNPLWVDIAYYGVAHSLTHLAQAIARAGNASRAVHLQRTMTPFLLSINTGDAWKGMVLLYLARVLSISGEIEEAVSKYQEAIALNPGLVDHVADEPDLEPIRGRM